MLPGKGLSWHGCVCATRGVGEETAGLNVWDRLGEADKTDSNLLEARLGAELSWECVQQPALSIPVLLAGGASLLSWPSLVSEQGGTQWAESRLLVRAG